MARKVAGLAFIFVSLLIANLAAAGTPHLVKDINSISTPLSSTPQAIGRLGDVELFRTDLSVPGSSRIALVKSDGTAAGTTTLRTFAGNGPYKPVITAGAHAFFNADDGHGMQLWVTDGTASGTQAVTSYTTALATDTLLAAFGNDLLFAHYTDGGKYQLYRTNGTSAGTTAIAQIDAYASNGRLELVVVGSRIYFLSSVNTFQSELWVSDGTAAGSHPIPAVSSLSANVHAFSLRALNDSVVFFTTTNTYGTELTRVDASESATVIDLAPGIASGAYGSYLLAVVNGYAYFAGSQGTDFELWRSDGTLAGTTLVKDVKAGTASGLSSSFPDIVPVGNRIVFIANDGKELWGSDGTAAGTVLLTSVYSFPIDALQNPIATDSARYRYIHTYPTAANARSTIITDGTQVGTVIAPSTLDGNPADVLQAAGDATAEYVGITSVNQTNGASKYWLYKFTSPGQLTSVRTSTEAMGWNSFVYLNGKLLLDAYDPTAGQELWISDDSGTRLLVDLTPQSTTDHSSASSLMDWNGKVAFVATDGIHGSEPWISDGTAAGTRMLADINPGAPGSTPRNLYVWNGALYFFANNGTSWQWMRIPAPDAAPEVLATVNPPLGITDIGGSQQVTCFVQRPVALGNKLFFSASTAAAGSELWSTDGTAAGTAMVADINTNAAGLGSQPCYLTVFQNRVYFAATASPSGVAPTLWSTDGTAAGTTQFANLTNATGLFVYSNELYFSAADPAAVTVVNQTWQTDGTTAGTRKLASDSPAVFAGIPFGSVNGKLLLLVTSFPIPPAPSGVSYSLWGSDGTSFANTLPLSDATLTAGAVSTSDRFYFSNTLNGDEEPWISDGTPAGTHRLADLDSAGSSHPTAYINFRGVILIMTKDSTGTHLWRTDGTESGTVQVGTVPPRPSGGSFAVSGQTLFFTGSDPLTGDELYAIPNDAPVAVADSAYVPNGVPITVDVLANDSDPDGSLAPASTHVVQAPAHGTTSVSSNGTVTYTSTSGYVGSDSFTYTVADNQGNTSSAATVTMNVTATPIPIDGDKVVVHASKGGGGPLRWYDLLALAGVALWRLVRISPHSTALWKNYLRL